MPQPLSRCRIVPLPDDQASFEIEGVERLRWHYGPQYPRLFFYPLIGPSGQTLTRMGHPGAPNHDHHRSIWFAHADAARVNYWTDIPGSLAAIRQKSWLVYRDGEDEAAMAVLLHWHDGASPRPVMEQELIAFVRPADRPGETLLELQSTFRPTADSLTLNRTNFGFLAVRVAANISAHFGGGQISASTGLVGEPAIFGTVARWMDYSGPSPAGGIEGVTYFDHLANPRYPSHWHVREDGWMGASFCFEEPYTIERQRPLILRYLLHAHGGAVDPDRADRIAATFLARPTHRVVKSTVRHQQYRIEPAV